MEVGVGDYVVIIVQSDDFICMKKKQTGVDIFIFGCIFQERHGHLTSNKEKDFNQLEMQVVT